MRARVSSLFEQGAAIMADAKDMKPCAVKRRPPPPTAPDPGIRFGDARLWEWGWARRCKEVVALLKSAREQSASATGASTMPDAKETKARDSKRPPPPPPTMPDPGVEVKDGDLSLLLKWLRIKK